MNTCVDCEYFIQTIKDRGECLYSKGSALIVRGFQRGCKHFEEKV